MEGRLTRDYIRLLELMMFDQDLFQKEFNKTKKWVSDKEMEVIESWFRKNYGNEVRELAS